MPRVPNLFRAPHKHLEELSEVSAVRYVPLAIRSGFQREQRGRRGMLCRVLEGGVIRRGDSIEKLS